MQLVKFIKERMKLVSLKLMGHGLCDEARKAPSPNSALHGRCEVDRNADRKLRDRPRHSQFLLW